MNENICPREEPIDIDYFKFKEALEKLREVIGLTDDKGQTDTPYLFDLLNNFEKEVLE